MESLKYQFRLCPIIDPETGDDVVVGSKHYNALVNIYGEPFKVRSPKSGVYITVGKGAYNNLLKDGYTEKEIFLGKKNNNINKTVPKNIKKDIDYYDYLLPMEIFLEIMSHMKTIDKLNFCKVSKQMHELCEKDEHVKVLKSNIGYQILACGYQNTFIIKDDKLYGVGSNAHGQFGLGVQGKGYGTGTPKVIPIPNNYKPLSVACGCDHMVVLTTGGLYGCGRNNKGQLTGDARHYLTLTPIHISGNIKFIHCNNATTYVITDNGLYFFGRSMDYLTHRCPTLISNYPSIYLVKTYPDYGVFATRKGIYFFKKNVYSMFVSIDKINDILDISCGKDYMMILTKTGLYGKGDNSCGQLGNGFIEEGDLYGPRGMDNILHKVNLYNVVKIT